MSFRDSSAVPTVIGGQILLRPVREGDASAAFDELHGRTSILRWLRWRGPESLAELALSFATWRTSSGDKSNFLFAVVERESERFIGTLGIRLGREGGGADFGYWLAEDVWGKGFGTETIRLGCWFAFHRLEVPSVCAWVFVGNEASRVILERNGFELVRTMQPGPDHPSQADHPGQPGQPDEPGHPGESTHAEWYFVLLAGDWRERVQDWSPEYAERRGN